MAPRSITAMSRFVMIGSAVSWGAWIAIYLTVEALTNTEVFPPGFPSIVSMLLGVLSVVGVVLWIGGQTMDAHHANRALIEQIRREMAQAQGSHGRHAAVVVPIRHRDDLSNVTTLRNPFPPIRDAAVGRAIVPVNAPNVIESTAGELDSSAMRSAPAGVDTRTAPRPRRARRRPAQPGQPARPEQPDPPAVPDSIYMADMGKAVDLGRQLEREHHRRGDDATNAG